MNFQPPLGLHNIKADNEKLLYTKSKLLNVCEKCLNKIINLLNLIMNKSNYDKEIYFRNWIIVLLILLISLLLILK